MRGSQYVRFFFYVSLGTSYVLLVGGCPHGQRKILIPPRATPNDHDTYGFYFAETYKQSAYGNLEDALNIIKRMWAELKAVQSTPPPELDTKFYKDYFDQQFAHVNDTIANGDYTSN